MSGNEANNGGAIYARNNTIATLINSTLSGNTANNNGGAIYGRNNTVLTLQNSTLSGNTAAQDGGAIYQRNNQVTLENSTVSGNQATRYGGGIAVTNDSTLTLNNVTIAANSASQGGGLLNGAGSTLKMTEFYRQLRHQEVTLKAAALQQAQLALLRGEGGPLQTLSADSSTQAAIIPPDDLSHPYYWAGFTIVRKSLVKHS